MLVKHASINKEALFGAMMSLGGKALGFGAKGLLKGGWWGLKNTIKHPGKALGIGGTAYSTAGAASNAMEQIGNAAATPYRYF